MKTKPSDAIDTKNGFKIFRGTAWSYYYIVECACCGAKIFSCKQNLLRSGGKAFCDKACQSKYRHSIIDPLGASIMDKIDTPEFMYLLGLIASDGHITYPPNYVHYSCDIGLKDVDLIERLHTIFGGRINRDNLVHWRLNNIGFIQYLLSLGFTHDKSYTLDLTNWFNNLSINQQAHFMRGVFDGDGTISKNKQNLWRVGIVSASLPFIELIYNFAGVGNYVKDRGCYQFYITNKLDINTFLSKIYHDSTLHLSRKHVLYHQFLNEYAQNKRRLYKIGRKRNPAVKSP